MRARGFSLIELVMVIVIAGILAAALVLFLKPTVESYLDSRGRADLTDIADTALRRMAKDIRSAVPNSVRSVSPTCFQLVPTVAGGRYRMASDTVNDTPPLPCAPSGTCSAPLDTALATTVFDVLSPMATVPAPGDWIVVDNQNADDVYAGTNRAPISVAPTIPRISDGLHRITVAPATQFPPGYGGGRFVVVPSAEPTVFYSCVGSTLYRTVAAFDANQATTCALTSSTPVATVAVVATNLMAPGCTFTYDPNLGATQQSGFVWLRLELNLGRDNGSIAFAQGVHVDNVP